MLRIRNFTWLPRPLKLLAPWFNNFALKFAAFAASLGFTPADVIMVQEWNAMIQWLLASEEAMKTSGKGLSKFRDETLFLEKNDAAPILPFTDLPAQPEKIVWGIVEQLDNLVGRIRLADNYSDEIGAQLGINPIPKGSISPEDLMVIGEYTPAAGGYEMAVVVSNRGEADQAVLQIRIVGQEKWLDAKTFTGKGANFVYTGETDGKPLQLQARIQLYKNNQPYGSPSAAEYVTLNP